MKNSLIWPLALASQLLVAPAFAQGSGKNVTVLRMSGPQLGVRLVEVDQDAVSRLKLKEEKGALVTEVLKDSPAEKAGIRKDDVILRFQGVSVLTAAQLGRLVRDVPAGRKVDIDLVRNGAPLTVNATIENARWSGEGIELPEMGELGERIHKELSEQMGKVGDIREKTLAPRRVGPEGGPRPFAFRLDQDGPAWVGVMGNRARLGVSYNEIEGQLAEYFKAPTKTAILVESVVEGSAAEKAGIRAGDLLIKLGTRTIEDGDDLMKAVRALEAGKATPATVWRGGKAVELSVTVSEDDQPKVLRRSRPTS